MTPYTHGGDVLTARARFGGDVLDCSANLNPLGMPPAVQAAAAAAAADSARYPDPLCRALRAAIAAHDGVAPAGADHRPGLLRVRGGADGGWVRRDAPPPAPGEPL